MEIKQKILQINWTQMAMVNNGLLVTNDSYVISRGLVT